MKSMTKSLGALVDVEPFSNIERRQFERTIIRIENSKVSIYHDHNNWIAYVDNSQTQ